MCEQGHLEDQPRVLISLDSSRGGIFWLGVLIANSSFQVWFSFPGKLEPCLNLFLEALCSFFGFLVSISQGLHVR